MICPKCNSEIGRQPSCPYCGTLLSFPGQIVRPVPSSEPADPNLIYALCCRMYRRVKNLEAQNALLTKLILILLPLSAFLQIVIMLLIFLK